MQKFFSVRRGEIFPSEVHRNQAFLIVDNWDDFSYKTTYSLVVFDEHGREYRAGYVKIGQFHMKDDGGRPDIPDVFDSLDERFFSLGQDDSYYVTLNSLGPDLRDRILKSLRDVAMDDELFERALGEEVTRTSLLRTVSRSTVGMQFSRITRDGARISRYEFNYTYSQNEESEFEPATLRFVVEPDSRPPTNIHVLIGRNGVGKTFLLHNMARSLGDQSAEAVDTGHFTMTNEGSKVFGVPLFANLVFVTFSAFDNFKPLPNRSDKSEGMPCTYIGIKKSNKYKNDQRYAPKSPQDLADEFAESLYVCSSGALLLRWQRAIETLESDPYFQDFEVTHLMKGPLGEEKFKDRAKELFGFLSSGHKIVLLTITKLVEAVEERTLILLDEPEAHLHPPLLSAFVRALSDLLIDRNGVAIIATHSPVVLQEVPLSCVWKILSNDRSVDPVRLQSETFGENVGVLTRDVFGLEATDAGFHQLLRDVVAKETNYDAVIDKFGKQLGGEARAHVRALLANPRDRALEE